MPTQSVGEFITHAKARPGKVSYATGNSGGKIADELLKLLASINAWGRLVRIPKMKAQ
jgi:hypothetical protein